MVQATTFLRASETKGEMARIVLHLNLRKTILEQDTDSKSTLFNLVVPPGGCAY